MNFPRRNKSNRAFTLVEVILAILIISGIMTVLLYFYQRAAQVRQTALEEAEYLAESRLFLDQITGELRTARLVPDQFLGLEGTSNSLTFICTGIPQMARWIVSTNEPLALPPATDLKRVHYGLIGGTNLTAVRGLDRSEELLLNLGAATTTNTTELLPEEESATNALSDFEKAELPLIVTNELAPPRLPLTARIQYLHFRYWSGTNWVDDWSGLDLPNGVEITLGHEAMPAEATDVYPFEILRRVVYLPNSAPPANKVLLEPDDLESLL